MFILLNKDLVALTHKKVITKNDLNAFNIINDVASIAKKNADEIINKANLEAKKIIDNAKKSARDIVDNSIVESTMNNVDLFSKILDYTEKQLSQVVIDIIDSVLHDIKADDIIIACTKLYYSKFRDNILNIDVIVHENVYNELKNKTHALRDIYQHCGINIIIDNSQDAICTIKSKFSEVDITYERLINIINGNIKAKIIDQQ